MPTPLDRDHASIRIRLAAAGAALAAVVACVVATPTHHTAGPDQARGPGCGFCWHSPGP